MQKIRITKNGGISEAKYGRMIERTGRDRPGGHHPAAVYDSFGGWETHFGPKGRKHAKRVFSKKARREHARITEEAVREWNSDRQDVWENQFLYDSDEAREWHEDWQAEQERWFWEDWDNVYYDYYGDEPYDFWDYYEPEPEFVEIDADKLAILKLKARLYDQLTAFGS